MALSKTKALIFERRIAIIVIGSSTSIIGINYFEQGLHYISYIVILIIGYSSSTQKNALINGALYGAALYLTNSLMIDDYSYLMYIITFAVLFIIIGALVGIAIAYIGYSVRVLTRKKS